MKKLAIIFSIRRERGEEVRRAFLRTHGEEYVARVAGDVDQVRGFTADLYIRVSPDYRNMTRREVYIWDDLFDMVHQWASRNNAPVHDSSKYSGEGT